MGALGALCLYSGRAVLRDSCIFCGRVGSKNVRTLRKHGGRLLSSFLHFLLKAGRHQKGSRECLALLSHVSRALA